MNALAVTAQTATAELLDLARTGDRDAFTELVERHHEELVRIAYAITCDLDGARDAAQLAWLKAWQRLPSIREPERLRTWLVAIAANEARQNVRARSRRQVREITPVERDLERPAETGTPTADRMDLSAALVRLKATDRQLLALRYVAGMTAEEIGPAIGLSASGVRTRLSRLVQRLREELDHD